MIDFTQTLDELIRGTQQGLHRGGQICVVRDDDTLLDASFGHDWNGEPLSSDRIMLWLSASKPVTAVAALQLWEKGLLSLNDPVARFIPEFAVNGKESITIWNILTHTGGFRFFDDAWLALKWDQIIQKISEGRPEPRWNPGHKAGYHPASSWFILGEIIQRVSGHPLGEYLKENVFEPAEMQNTWMGIPETDQPEVVERIARLCNTASEEPELSHYETGGNLSAVLPGSGLRGPASDLAAFYRHLIWSDVLLSPQTFLAMSARHRTAMHDKTFHSVIDWGLGFMLNSYHYKGSYPYSFGSLASPRAFGHGGAQCAMAFADPQFGLVAAWVVNGSPGEPAHQERQERINSAIYRDLGLGWEHNVE